MTIPELRKELITYIASNSLSMSGEEYINTIIDIIIGRVLRNAD